MSPDERELIVESGIQARGVDISSELDQAETVKFLLSKESKKDVYKRMKGLFDGLHLRSDSLKKSLKDLNQFKVLNDQAMRKSAAEALHTLKNPGSLAEKDREQKVADAVKILSEQFLIWQNQLWNAERQLAQLQTKEAELPVEKEIMTPVIPDTAAEKKQLSVDERLKIIRHRIDSIPTSTARIWVSSWEKTLSRLTSMAQKGEQKSQGFLTMLGELETKMDEIYFSKQQPHTEQPITGISSTAAINTGSAEATAMGEDLKIDTKLRPSTNVTTTTNDETDRDKTEPKKMGVLKTIKGLVTARRKGRIPELPPQDRSVGESPASIEFTPAEERYWEEITGIAAAAEAKDSLKTTDADPMISEQQAIAILQDVASLGLSQLRKIATQKSTTTDKIAWATYYLTLMDGATSAAEKKANIIAGEKDRNKLALAQQKSQKARSAYDQEKRSNKTAPQEFQAAVPDKPSAKVTIGGEQLSEKADKKLPGVQKDLGGKTEKEQHEAESLLELLQRIEAEVERDAAAARAAAGVTAPEVPAATAPKITSDDILPDYTLDNDSAITNSTTPTSPPPPGKKSFWSRAKNSLKLAKEAMVTPEWRRGLKKAVINKEVGKALLKGGYETVGSVLGIKFVGDLIGAMVGGVIFNDEKKWYLGDMHNWRVGRKQVKAEQEIIGEAYTALLEAVAQARRGEQAASGDAVKDKMDDLVAKINDAKQILPPEKINLIQQLQDIVAARNQQVAEAQAEREEQTRQVIKLSIRNEVSGIKIMRDLTNLILIPTGAGAAAVVGRYTARAPIYMLTSALERAGKARAQYEREVAAGDRMVVGGAFDKFKAENSFILKDLIVNSARETGRGLAWKGEQEGATGVRRTVDLVKALGTVARIVGIGGVFLNDLGNRSQAMDRVIDALDAGHTQTGGALSNTGRALWDNFKENAVRSWNVYRHPIDTVVHPTLKHVGLEKDNGAGGNDLPPNNGEADWNTFIAEHHDSLQTGGQQALQELINRFPKLNNTPSLQHILEASKVGSNVHDLTHGYVITSNINTFDEAGGTRRLAIFEEVLKHQGKEDAISFLQNQGFGDAATDHGFSHQHLSHLPREVQGDLSALVAKYQAGDKKVIRGLYEAFRGKESTELANAGLERTNADGIVVRDIHHVGTDSYYFGVKDKHLVLSGGGGSSSSVTHETLPQVSPEPPSHDAGVQHSSGVDSQFSLPHAVPYDADIAGPPDIPGRLIDHSISTIAETAPITAAAGSTAAAEAGNGGVEQNSGHHLPVNAAKENPTTAATVEKTAHGNELATVADIKKAAPVTTDKTVPTDHQQLKAGIQHQLQPSEGGRAAELFAETGLPDMQAGRELHRMVVGLEQQLKASLDFSRVKDYHYFDRLKDNLHQLENHLTNVKAGADPALPDDYKLVEAIKLYHDSKGANTSGLKNLLVGQENTPSSQREVDLLLSEHHPQSDPVVANNTNTYLVWNEADHRYIVQHNADVIFGIDEANKQLIFYSKHNIEQGRMSFERIQQTIQAKPASPRLIAK